MKSHFNTVVLVIAASATFSPPAFGALLFGSPAKVPAVQEQVRNATKGNAESDEQEARKAKTKQARSELRKVQREMTAAFRNWLSARGKADTKQKQASIAEERDNAQVELAKRAIAIYRESGDEALNLSSIRKLDAVTHSAARAELLAAAVELHGGSEKILGLVHHFGRNMGGIDVHAFMEAVSRKSKHRDVKAWSTLYQAEIVQQHREASPDEKKYIAANFTDDTFRKYDVKWSGKAGGTRLEKLIKLCETEFADVKMVRKRGLLDSLLGGDDEPLTVGQAIKPLRIRMSLVVGSVAPDIVGEDLDGVSFKLSDYRGKVVLLDFWGDWCGPCQAMYPHERSLVKQLADKPFALIGVNSDEDLADIRRIVAKKNLRWRSFQNESSTGTISDKWAVQAWPTIFVLDAKGVIRFRGHEEGLDEIIEELLAEMGHKVEIAMDDPGESQDKPKKKPSRKMDKDESKSPNEYGAAFGQYAKPTDSRLGGRLGQALDQNGDGKLDPYEALDTLLTLQREQGGRLDAMTLRQAIAEREQNQAEEIDELLDNSDANNDGKVTARELEAVVGDFAEVLDGNGDGVVMPEEVRNGDIGEAMFMSKEDIADEVRDVFREFDTNKDKAIVQSEVDDDEIWAELREGDRDNNGRLTAAEMTASLSADNRPASFRVKGGTAYMSGVINSETPVAVLRLIFEHPKVRTIEMEQVPGSVDDSANLRAARYVRECGFTTVLRSDAMVASGGTDFFLAGTKRVVEKGAKVGIHSWGGPVQGSDIPKDHPQHQLYLKYYKEMGTPAEFYWRTLEAAPADRIYWMAEKELKQFKFRSDGSGVKKGEPKPHGDDAADERHDEADEIEVMFKELDRNGDGRIQRSEVPEENRDDFDEADQNSDGVVTLRELEAAMEAEADDDVDEQELRDKDRMARDDPGVLRFKASPKQLAKLNSKAAVASNTKWNLDQMAKRGGKIAQNAQGHYEATFPDGHVLVFVPQGSFAMGTDSLKRLDRPVHKVGLRGYWIGKYLVTNAQFEQFVDDTSFKTDAEQPKAEGPYVYNFKERYFKPTPGRTWRDAFKNHVASHPVTAVSWHDSQAFSKWLGKKLDLQLRLPTEAEWEKAARGTDGRRFPWGNAAPDGTQCNFCDSQFAKVYPQAKQGHPDQKADDGYAGLSPVDAFPKGASPYGVFDMGGNVSNWVADWMGEYPDFDVIEPKGPSRGNDRGMRGGFWVADAGLTKASIREQHNCRSECRSADDPRSSDDHLGFRFAMQFESTSADAVGNTTRSPIKAVQISVAELQREGPSEIDLRLMVEVADSRQQDVKSVEVVFPSKKKITITRDQKKLPGEEHFSGAMREDGDGPFVFTYQNIGIRSLESYGLNAGGNVEFRIETSDGAVDVKVPFHDRRGKLLASPGFPNLKRPIPDSALSPIKMEIDPVSSDVHVFMGKVDESSEDFVEERTAMIRSGLSSTSSIKLSPGTWGGDIGTANEHSGTSNGIAWTVSRSAAVEFDFRVTGSQPESQNRSIKATRITNVPADFPARYRSAFDRYVQVIAPNGKPINIFAQKEITDGQLRHVRDVMLHYLTDLPGSEFGTNKGAIADRMADNRAIMMICKGHDGQFREPRINAQPLYADETIVEGTSAYINNEFEEHRDASLEEILHCVHDNGIGIDFRGAPKGVAPEFQREIRAATTHAMKNGIWPTRNSDGETAEWIDELRDEGSLTQEYLASVIDSYYGLWGPFDKDFGMWGIYIARTRKDIERKDPQGYAIVRKFFHPYLTYNAEVDASFKGTFSMAFDKKRPYTHKSQHLLHAHLTGANNSNLTGNDQDNTLGGNAGNNVIDGADGKDTVVFPKPKSAYKVTRHSDGSITVVGDGTDKLINVERLEFDGAKKNAARFVAPVAPNLR
ncbi:MAG: SUMF1/EgtB/PvdO family nonheme iron enzyme [Planctomycetota bacterium]